MHVAFYIPYNDKGCPKQAYHAIFEPTLTIPSAKMNSMDQPACPNSETIQFGLTDHCSLA